MYINNKGQMLVMFVIFVPIFIFLAGLLIDIGIAQNSKNRLNNTNITAIEYALDNYNEVMIRNIILENDNSLLKENITISKDKEIVTIKLVKEVDGIFGGILGFFNYKIESIYEGKYINNEKRVVKISSKKV